MVWKIEVIKIRYVMRRWEHVRMYLLQYHNIRWIEFSSVANKLDSAVIFTLNFPSSTYEIKKSAQTYEILIKFFHVFSPWMKIHILNSEIQFSIFIPAMNGRRRKFRKLWRLLWRKKLLKQEEAKKWKATAMTLSRRAKMILKFNLSSCAYN